ncbi:MAG: hypothetical protein AB2712_15500 [Candidatus Thiodiazotropha sp.]
MSTKLSQAIVFVSVGVALIVISSLLSSAGHTDISAILLNLGLVSVAVILVEYLWGTSGGNPIERQISTLSSEVTRLSETVDIVDSSKRVGLDDIYDCQANFGTQAEWEDVIRNAEDRVDIMGRTLFGWTRSTEFCQLIKRKVLNDGVEFRWLIMSENNKYLPLLTEEDINIGSILGEKLKEVKRRIKKAYDELPENKKHLIQVREFEDVPLYCAITRVDELFYVSPYLYSASSDGSPMLKVRGARSPWGQRYIKEFETIWENSTDVFSPVRTET